MRDKSLVLLRADCIDATRLIFKVINSEEQFRNIVSMGIHPYLSVVVEGIDKLIGLPMNEYQNIGEFSFERLYKRSRARTKIYSDQRLNKNLKLIKLVNYRVYQDLTDGNNLIQKIFIKLRGQETFGVFFLEQYPFYNNFIGYIDLLEVLDIKELDQITEDGSLNPISAFSSHLSNYILKGYETFGLEKKAFNDVEGVGLTINSKDFHLVPSSRNKIFNQHYDLNTSIFLYNILCSINYVLHVLPLLLSVNSNFYLRIKLICYFSSVESLAVLSKGYNHNSGATEYVQEIDKIIDKKRDLEKIRGLRNNIFHYQIEIEDKIEFEKLTDSTIIFNEILEHYTSMSRDEINNELDVELTKILNLINIWIL